MRLAGAVTEKRKREGGFALLFVFALAGMAAILLYTELPRAVFESQRAKEELLVSRGQEYQRGIQLYFRKFRKYPATMEELEKTNGVRFLRRRYVDPFTGKDDWRLVHVGANGQFTDSKVIKPQQPAQGTGLGTGFGTATAGQQPEVDPTDPALKRRASDVSAAEIGTAAGGVAPANPDDPNALPAGAPPAPGGNPAVNVNPAVGMNPGMPPGVGVGGFGGVGSVGGVGGVGSVGSVGGVGSVGNVGGVGGVGSVGVGQPSGSMPTGSMPTGPMPGMPVPGMPVPGMPGGGMPGMSNQRPITAEQISPALNVIQDLLTRPRQPPPGVIPAGPGQAAPGPITNPGGNFTATGPGAMQQGGTAFGGGGIAGVASKHEGKGIKLINERERIEEWEFIYDFGKDTGGRPGANQRGQQPANAGGMNPAMGNPAQGMGFGQQGGGGARPGGGMGSGGFGGGMGQGMGQPIGRPRN